MPTTALVLFDFKLFLPMIEIRNAVLHTFIQIMVIIELSDKQPRKSARFVGMYGRAG